MYNVSYHQYVSGNSSQPMVPHSVDFSSRRLADAAMKMLTKDIWSMNVKLTEFEDTPLSAH